MPIMIERDSVEPRAHRATTSRPRAAHGAKHRPTGLEAHVSSTRLLRSNVLRAGTLAVRSFRTLLRFGGSIRMRPGAGRGDDYD